MNKRNILISCGFVFAAVLFIGCFLFFRSRIVKPETEIEIETESPDEYVWGKEYSFQNEMEYDNDFSESVDNDAVTDYGEGNGFNNHLWDRNLPIGCKVLVSEYTDVYEAPSYDSKKIEYFNYDDTCTVAMIGDNLSQNRWDEFGYKRNHWVKIIDQKLQSGWVVSSNLTMHSPNPNPRSIEKKWSFYGTYGASFSPDGKYVCLKEWGAHNGTSGPLHVFDVKTGKKILYKSVAESYDSDSSEYTVFSPDSKYLYYEEDLVLYRINIEKKLVRSYGCPIYDHGEIREMALNKKGSKLLYSYNWCNEHYLGSVYDFETDQWTNIDSEKELSDIRKEFDLQEEYDFTPEFPNFNYYYSSIKVLPEKNLILCGTWNSEKMFHGVYFFELSSGKFLKAENPMDGEQGMIVYDFTINNDATKIAILAAQEDYRVTEMTHYICDLNLETYSPVIPEKRKTISVEKEHEALSYLCNNYFYLLDCKGDFVSNITFDYDNTFTACPDRNSFSIDGTFTLKYKHLIDQVEIKFNDFYTGTSEERSYIRPYLESGIINYEVSDFFTTGGVIDSYGQRFLTTNKSSEPYKVYEFQGREVIKYPDYRSDYDVKYIYINENLKMRSEPSVTSDSVYMPFYGYINDEYREEESRCVVFAGQQFRIIASSVEKDTIDGITDYWYMIYVIDNELDEWAQGQYVWVFGGYATTSDEM